MDTPDFEHGRVYFKQFGAERVNSISSNGSPSLAFRVMGLALRLIGWCQDKWTSSTGKLPKNRREITE